MQEIICCYRNGTRYGIRMEEDGLIRAGSPGLQLTWMDAKVGDWVVTPRQGKPVEVNALWYNALMLMSELAEVMIVRMNMESWQQWLAEILWIFSGMKRAATFMM